jgi:hypothetical protein
MVKPNTNVICNFGAIKKMQYFQAEYLPCMATRDAMKRDETGLQNEHCGPVV